MNVMTIDCEFAQPSGKTIQIGSCVHNSKTGELIDTFETYVDPGEPISEYITNLTSITDDNVFLAPKILEAYLMLKDFHAKHKCAVHPIVWGSGVRNDSSHIYQESGSLQPNFMGYRVIDAKTIFQSLRLHEGRGLKGGLETTCTKLGIGFEGRAHTALADAINTFRVWHHLVKKFDLAKKV